MERKFKPRRCTRCGKTGSLAAYAGRGYFHLKCITKEREEGNLFKRPYVKPMTAGDA